MLTFLLLLGIVLQFQRLKLLNRHNLSQKSKLPCKCALFLQMSNHDPGLTGRILTAENVAGYIPIVSILQ